MEAANCEAGGTILLAHPGVCKDNTRCPQVTCDNNNCGPNDDCKIVRYGTSCPIDTCVRRGCPDQCPFNYEPVCGSDGVTYPNTCAFEVANCQAGGTILLAPPEECTTGGSGNTKSCPRICPENLALVCGSDGISYGNECELRRADCQSTSSRITQAYTGECRGCSPVSCDNNNCGPGQDCTIVQPEGFVGLGQQPCPEVKCVKRECPDQCPFNYEPMCGTDGVTYGNTCQMEAANCEAGGTILLAYPGECKTDDARCPPVTCDNNNCGPDQDCKILEPHGSFGEHPCPEVTCVKRECPDQCPFNYEPVCGSDGVTYPNTCALGVASCEAGGTIIQAHPGECTNSGCRAVTCDNNNCGPDQDCKIFENPGHQACPELTCVKRECP